MNSDFLYYAFALVALVVGLFILKKVATCMVKTVVGVILVAVLAAIYWLYLSQGYIYLKALFVLRSIGFNLSQASDHFKKNSPVRQAKA